MTMKTTIDKAGRVVIPAPIREEAGLEPGTELEVFIDDFSIRLTRAVPGPKIVRRRGRLVARPRAGTGRASEVNVSKLVDEERNRWPF